MNDILHPEYRRIPLSPEQATLIAALDRQAMEAQGRLQVALQMAAAASGVNEEFRVVKLEPDALIVDPVKAA